jgi:aminocarboxymuconate-semialdehyde decarboxylase
MDLELRLRQMDERGIDLQVLSPNPLTFLHHVDAATAIEFSRRHNDGLAEIVGRHRDRLGGLAQLPMQDPAQAVAELHRAVSELGLLGACIGTDLGRPLDDPALDAVYRACTELDVPLFIHPAPGGIDAPRRDERLARFDADLWLGFAYEEALAVATLVLGGVLTRHPELDVCVSHGGGATSWLAERMRHAAATRPWADAGQREGGAIDARLARLWWDAHVGGPRALAALIAASGTDRLVGGTNFAGWDQTADPSFGDAALAATLDANARRLLRLDR